MDRKGGRTLVEEQVQIMGSDLMSGRRRDGDREVRVVLRAQVEQ